VSRAEVDDRRHSIELNTTNKTAVTCLGVAQIAASVFPFVAHKRHPFFPVRKAERTGQRIHGIHSENSTTFLWLCRLFVIGYSGGLCAPPLRKTEASHQQNQTKKDPFHDSPYRLARFGSGTSS